MPRRRPLRFDVRFTSQNTLGDEREVNVSLDYRIGRGVLESFWLRVRGSWLQRSTADRDSGEIRLILRYEPPLL